MATLSSYVCTGCTARSDSVFRGSIAAELVPKLPLQFSKGEYIFKEGQPAKGVYCIKSGKASILKKNAAGESVFLAGAGPSELLGIAAVSQSTPFSTSALVVEDCEVCFIPGEDFIKLLTICPTVSTASLKMLSSKLSKLRLFTP